MTFSPRVPLTFRRAQARTLGRATNLGLRVGTDLSSVSEIQASVSQFGLRYLQRLFTASELQDCAEQQAWRYASLAARFAAKEAVIKVLQPNKSQAISWTEIEVRRLSNGAPSLHLHGRARQLAQAATLRHWSISLSHESDYATAMVVAHP